GAGEALQRTDSFSKCRAGNIHGGVSGADHDHMLAQVETVRVVQVIDPKVYMTKGLSFDVQRVGTPHSGSDKNRFIAVAEQVVNGDGSADGRVWTNFDIFQDKMAVLEIIENAFGKPEFRNAVAQDAADLVLAFKNRDLIALARQKDSD